MGRRDADERPPIEMWDAEPGIGTTQHVEVRPRGARRSRVRMLAIAALVAGVVVGGIALGGGDDEPQPAADDQPEQAADDDEPRDNSDHIELGNRLTTTTERITTTTLAALGPLFGEPMEGVLLTRLGTSWTRLDLTTGKVDEITLPDVDTYTAVAMAGGVVIPSGSGEVRYYPVLGDREPEGVALGRGNQVARAGPDRVWLFDQPLGGEIPQVTHARLVDLRGRVLRELDVPGYQTIATPDEVLVNRGGRVYAYDESGLRPIATGWINGAFGDAALITACDDDGDCSLRMQPTDGGPSHLLASIEDPDATWYEAPSVARDGRLALVSRGPLADARLLLYSEAGEPIAELDVPRTDEAALPQWLPGDLGLLIGTASGLQWVKPEGGAWVIEELPLMTLTGNVSFFLVTP